MRLLLLLMLLKTQGCAPVETRGPVVFMGDSITDEWYRLDPGFFEGKPYINKGISGQTTAQMLARFRHDVIDYRPELVVILGGTNDIAQNQGPVEIMDIFENIRAMAEAAKGNNIAVVLCSVLPAFDYPWRPGMRPDEKIPQLNRLIKDYAVKEQIEYADFYSAMKDEKEGLKKELGRDGVHPTIDGYKVMEPILEEAITRALKSNPGP